MSMVKYWIKSLKNYLSYKISVYANEYSKAKRPKRIILIRHGESTANINSSIYATTPDNKIPLSKFGFSQAQNAGEKIKKIVNNESLQFYVSPFLRTQQTSEEILKSFDPSKVKVFIDPRIREQEWGNYQNPTTKHTISQTRNEVGTFYYRFAEGESGADVYDRVSSFLESLFREMDNYDREKKDNYIIVSHGLFMRLMVMRFYKLSIDSFEKMDNPKNCEIWIMERNSEGKYELKTKI